MPRCCKERSTFARSRCLRCHIRPLPIKFIGLLCAITNQATVESLWLAHAGGLQKIRAIFGRFEDCLLQDCIHVFLSVRVGGLLLNRYEL